MIFDSDRPLSTIFLDPSPVDDETSRNALSVKISQQLRQLQPKLKTPPKRELRPQLPLPELRSHRHVVHVRTALLGQIFVLQSLQHQKRQIPPLPPTSRAVHRAKVRMTQSLQDPYLICQVGDRSLRIGAVGSRYLDSPLFSIQHASQHGTVPPLFAAEDSGRQAQTCGISSERERDEVERALVLRNHGGALLRSGRGGGGSEYVHDVLKTTECR